MLFIPMLWFFGRLPNPRCTEGGHTTAHDECTFCWGPLVNVLLLLHTWWRGDKSINDDNNNNNNIDDDDDGIATYVLLSSPASARTFRGAQRTGITKTMLTCWWFVPCLPRTEWLNHYWSHIVWSGCFRARVCWSRKTWMRSQRLPMIIFFLLWLLLLIL
jgi:hypothetical protein